MKIISLPVLDDNYIHILRDDSSNTTIVVDPASTEPVLKALAENNWPLTHILITHHHGDHIGGVAGLVARFPACEIFGYGPDQSRLPRLTHLVGDGDVVKIANHIFEVWHLPGHTTGHIGYISRQLEIAFTGDVLFGMGCGRLFEGSPVEMFKSLSRFKSLSLATKIYCTHEYTVTNGHFALSVLPDNKKISERLQKSISLRKDGKFTVPLTLSEELETNPFLLAENVSVFTNFREQRNVFKVAT